MIRILFVCHGNICRSPMAEFIMKDMVKRRGLDALFSVASAATSDEEIGNPVYPPVRALLSARGISCAGKTAVQLRASDYDRYDSFIGMDGANRRNMLRLFGGDPQGKVSLLLDYTDRPRDVADPWYTRDFRAAEADVERGCAALLNHLMHDTNK
ncbi:MAG: low molecular weight phosphotyrosine protein phosphatase [Oscillospiraceae bacterium]|nr:low molecular weight phosphotyrosine protein phosphatase [Oscillospiraceae bacterium]